MHVYTYTEYQRFILTTVPEHKQSVILQYRYNSIYSTGWLHILLFYKEKSHPYSISFTHRKPPCRQSPGSRMELRDPACLPLHHPGICCGLWLWWGVGCPLVMWCSYLWKYIFASRVAFEVSGQNSSLWPKQGKAVKSISDNTTTSSALGKKRHCACHLAVTSPAFLTGLRGPGLAGCRRSLIQSTSVRRIIFVTAT